MSSAEQCEKAGAEASFSRPSLLAPLEISRAPQQQNRQLRRPIDFFSLYVLFSYFRQRDVLKGIFFLCLYKLCVHIHVHKTTFERNFSLE